MNDFDKKFWTDERRLKYSKAYAAYFEHGWLKPVCTDNKGNLTAGTTAIEEMRLAFRDFENEISKFGDFKYF